MRWLEQGAQAARFSVRLDVVLAVGLVVASCTSGCAILGQHTRSAEGVAAARELSRQGVASLEMGQTEQAESLLRRAIAESPDDAESHQYMAEALLRRGAGQEALTQI